MTKHITIFFNDNDSKTIDIKNIVTDMPKKELVAMLETRRFAIDGKLYKVGHYELYKTTSSLSSYGLNGCINLFPLDYEYIR